MNRMHKGVRGWGRFARIVRANKDTDQSGYIWSGYAGQDVDREDGGLGL